MIVGVHIIILYASEGELARRIMRSYARNQGSQATAGTILADIANNESTERAPRTEVSIQRLPVPGLRINIHKKRINNE